MTPLQFSIASMIVLEAENRLRELVASYLNMNVAGATLEAHRDAYNNSNEAMALERAMLPAIHALTKLEVPTPPPASFDEVAAMRARCASLNMQSGPPR